MKTTQKVFLTRGKIFQEKKKVLKFNGGGAKGNSAESFWDD